MFIPLSVYSQDLIYKVKIEKPNNEQIVVYCDSTDVKNIYFALYNQQINIKESFSNDKLFFKHEDENYIFNCILYYIDENGKIKKFKKKLLKNQIKKQY